MSQATPDCFRIRTVYKFVKQFSNMRQKPARNGHLSVHMVAEWLAH